MSNNNGTGFLLGAIVGAAIGSAVALLYAPKSGRELREDLGEEVDYWVDRASEYRDYAMERGQEVYGAAAETSGDIKVSLKQSASNLKDNEACTVCGSLEHPKPAVLVDSMLTKEEINEVEDEFSSSDLIYNPEFQTVEEGEGSFDKYRPETLDNVIAILRMLS